MRRSAFVPAAVAIVAHLTALGGRFVWLDHAHIEGGLAIASSPSRFPELFTRGFAGTGYYRPLMSLSLSIDALLSGGAPWFFHATNLVCHAAAAAMTTVVAANALGLSRRAAILAGVLFAVHPLSGIVANAIAFRSEALVAIALLTVIWAHVQRRPIIAALAIAAGGLTKENALALTPLFLIALEMRLRRTDRGPKEETRPQQRRSLFASEAAAFGLVLLLRLAYAPEWRAAHESLSMGDALGTRLAGVAKSTAAVVLPIDRSICDAFAVTHWWQPASIAGFAVVIALATFAWRQRRAGSAIAMLLAFAMLPALQIVPVQRWWSPHYLYVPLAFVAMSVAVFAERFIIAGTKYARLATYVIAAIVIVLGGVSLYDGRRYVDDTTLWTPEVTHQHVCREGQFYLGESDRHARRWDAAARRYEAALAPRAGMLAYVDRSAALQNLGTARLEQGRFAEARRAFATALEGTKDEQKRRELTHNLAAAALGEGNAAEAASLLESETSRPDALPESIMLRAMALRRLGRDEDAQRLMERLPRLPPQH